MSWRKYFGVIIFAAGIFFSLPHTGYGQSAQDLKTGEITKVGTTIGGFLKFEVGPRAAGLGGAYVGLADDITTMAWNPAGISNLDKMSFGVTHAQLYAGITHSFFGYTFPMGNSNTVGLSAVYLNSGEMEVTTIDIPDGTGEYFSVQDLALGLTFSRQVTDFLSLGITGKLVREQIYREVAQTATFDFGSYFDTGVMNTILGMAITNFSGEMKLDGPDLDASSDINQQNQGNRIVPSRLTTESWPLPLTFRMGIRTDLIGGIANRGVGSVHRLSLLADANDPVDHKMRSNFGLEYEWSQLLSMRLGYHNNYDTAGLAGGFGLHLDAGGADLNFDYALSDYGLLDYVHQFAVQISL